jgi:hypothetical protein
VEQEERSAKSVITLRHKSADRVQKAWRGFYTRKHILPAVKEEVREPCGGQSGCAPRGDVCRRSNSSRGGTSTRFSRQS